MATWGKQYHKFFYRIANGRRMKRNYTYFFFGDDRIEGCDNLLKHATEYCKQLFGLAQGNPFLNMRSNWHYSKWREIWKLA